MKKILIIVDMQNDFVTGSLANEDAQKIVPRIVNKLKKFGESYSSILITRDTHWNNYLDTLEGKKLPIKHCISGTDGHLLVDDIYNTLDELKKKGVYLKTFRKSTFASNKLIDYLKAIINDNYEIEIIGVCTDICVVSNALAIKSALPNTRIIIDSSCCAGTTKDNHSAAIKVMRSCQIDTRNFKNKKNKNKSYKKQTIFIKKGNNQEEENFIEQSD